MRRGVRVPASTANIGPGYDSFGLALALYNDFEAELADEWRVEVGGEGAGRLARGAENDVARAMARVFAEAGRPELRAAIECHNGIPVGRGLGSSAAAIVGGLVLGEALSGARLPRSRLLALGAEFEGHADNIAAALYGGFCITVTESGVPASVPMGPAGGLAVVAVIGEHELPTSAARESLPAVVPHADAAANAARAALVALGITGGDPDHLRLGLRDAIHEQYRAALIPDLEAIRALFDAAGVGPAVLSGAGPTVVSLVQAPDDERAYARAAAFAEQVRPVLAGIGRCRVLALAVDRGGASLR